MRIVIDLQGAQGENRKRGIGRYSLSMAQALVRHKGEHEIIVALNGLLSESIESIRAAFDGILPQENILVWDAPAQVRQLEAENVWRRKTAELIREAFLLSLSPDILFVPSLFEGLVDDVITSVGRFTQDMTTVVTLYDLIPLINKKPYLANPVVELWYENKLDNIRRADALLAISESSRQEGIQYLGSSPELTINASLAEDAQFQKVDVDTATEQYLRQHYKLSKPFVMYTGGIDHRKNIEGLIRAFALLPQAVRELHQLAIICSVDPASRLRLEALIKEEGLSELDVILTGYVPEEDLIAFYGLCKAFIFPSWHEGFGLPALEAMACGAPVIGANTSSLPEVIGREDALFDPYQDASIAEKLAQVLTDDVFRKALIKHGLKQAQYFSWENSAQIAMGVFEKLYAKKKPSVQIAARSNRRLRLAYVSPLPPRRTGIADYSAELLPELSRYYDIDVIVDKGLISDPWIKSNCTVLDASWLQQHADLYDRVLYHFGNSDNHQYMFPLLEQVPGVVVLHDFFLSGIVAHMDVHGFNPGSWSAALYHEYGYGAVRERFLVEDTADVVWQYPCNKAVIEAAKGVIVHSENSCRLAKRWLEPSLNEDWTVIPLLRVPLQPMDRAAARQALGLSKDDFVVCSFGLLGPSKLNQRLLDAWLKSSLRDDRQCVLVFVGENTTGYYGVKLTTTIDESGVFDRIRITGWSDMEQFRQWLSAADMGVQLRTLSRGETSAAVLDCMNYGLPTIVNANGSMADLPKNAVYLLEDEFKDEDLIQALETFRKDNRKRQALGKRARDVILNLHAPRRCADQYFNTIEKYYSEDSKRSIPERLIAQIGHSTVAFPDEGVEQIWIDAAKSIARNHPISHEKRLYVDISELVQRDAKSGIQRVVRSVLIELLSNPPAGYKVEPVYASGGEYFYARQFTLRFLGCPDHVLFDEPVLAFNGDIFLGLDLQPTLVPSHAEYYQRLRNIGVAVYFVVYDLLPVLEPETFPSGADAMFTAWLNTIAQADGLLCISRSVADEMYTWLQVFGPKRLFPLSIGWFHLGANVDSSVPTRGLPEDADEFIAHLAKHPTFLVVGTVEPRKNQLQVLQAFDLLWAAGVDAHLVIVGKQGWMVEALIETINHHVEKDKRLFWLHGISDEYLEQIYAASSCLIAASKGEGFGLPLIEAAQKKVPMIARDIPVFREVAGDHALYFSGNAPDALADCVRQWLALDIRPQSVGMPWLTWEQSTQQMLDVMLNQKWYKSWLPDDVLRFAGADLRLSSQVGKRTMLEMHTTGTKGCLLYGPYVRLAAGSYQLLLQGQWDQNLTEEVEIDIAYDGGEKVILKQPFRDAQCSASLLLLKFDLHEPCDNLEIRVWVDEHSNMKISLIEIESLDGEIVEHDVPEKANNPIQIGDSAEVF